MHRLSAEIITTAARK